MGRHLTSPIVRRIYGNLARLLGGKAAAAVLSLGYMAIAGRVLGPRDYGVLILVHTYIMTVGGIIEFPGWHAVVRYGAQAVAADDRPRLARLLAFAGAVEAGGGVLAIVAAATLAPLLGAHIGWSQTAIDFALPYSLAVLASIRTTPAGYLQLIGRFDLLGWHNAVAPVIRLGGALLVAATHTGLHGFLVAWLAAALAEWAAMWAFGLIAARGRVAIRDLRGGLGNVQKENPGLWRFMLAANADLTLSELAGRVTPLAVGGMLGPVAAGLYAVAQRATAVLAQPATILGQAAYAELARLAAAGDRGPGIRTAMAHAAALAILVAIPVCLVVAVFGPGLAVLMAGDGFAPAGEIMLWLTCARVILLVGPIMSGALTALGRPSLSVWSNAISGLGFLVALPALLGWLGLRGAGLHAVIQALGAVALLAGFVLRETRVPRSRAAPAPS